MKDIFKWVSAIILTCILSLAIVLAIGIHTIGLIFA